MKIDFHFNDFTRNKTKQRNETGWKKPCKGLAAVGETTNGAEKKEKKQNKKNTSIIMRDWNGVALSKVTIGDKSTRMRCRPIAVAAQKLG